MVEISRDVYGARCTRSGPVIPMAARGVVRAPLPWRPSGLPARIRLRHRAYARSRLSYDADTRTRGRTSGHAHDDADRVRSLARPRPRMVAGLPDRVRAVLA